MSNGKSDFNSINFVWALIDTFVNILTMVVVYILLVPTINDFLLAFIMIVFGVWAFKPIFSCR